MIGRQSNKYLLPHGNHLKTSKLLGGINDCIDLCAVYLIKIVLNNIKDGIDTPNYHFRFANKSA